MATASVEPVVRSEWDYALPNLELRDVRIEAHSLIEAWRQIGTSLLLRTCIFRDIETDSDSNKFIFDKKSTTCRELLDAFITTYPTYTYTQDNKTGVIWIHRKVIKYADILNVKVEIDRPVIQVPMCTVVLTPLQPLLGATPYPLGNKNWVNAFNYYIDLPRGVFTARDIINACCAAHINTAFWISKDNQGVLEIAPWNLMYANPLAPPRAAAVRFWKTEVDASEDGIPTLDQIGDALSDPVPRKRWAAGVYLRATYLNYQTMDLMVNGRENAERVVWAALQLKRIEVPGEEFPYLTKFLSQADELQIALTNQLSRLNPGLALLACMELAREKNDASVMDVVANHKLSVAEIAAIKPDLIRIARESKLIRDELSKMKFDDQELSPEGLRELESTNIFSHIPAEEK